MATEPEITGIEVAFDAFPTADSHDIAAMAERLFRCIADPPSANRRITGPRGTRGHVESALENRRSNREALARGLSLFIGNVTDVHTQRTYVKNKGWARFENTLTGTAVPFHTLDEWQAYRFSELAKLFRWRKHPQSSGLLALLRDWPPALAGPIKGAARRNHRRINLRGTLADRDLNEAARIALRRLTISQRRQSRPVQISAGASGNLDETEASSA